MAFETPGDPKNYSRNTRSPDWNFSAARRRTAAMKGVHQPHDQIVDDRILLLWSNPDCPTLSPLRLPLKTVLAAERVVGVWAGGD